MITSYAVTANPMLDAAPRLRSLWLQTVVGQFTGCADGQRSLTADIGKRGEAGGRFRS